MIPALLRSNEENRSCYCKKKTAKTSDRKIREILMKKVSRVFDTQKNNQIKNSFKKARRRICEDVSTNRRGVQLEQETTTSWNVAFDIGR